MYMRRLASAEASSFPGAGVDGVAGGWVFPGVALEGVDGGAIARRRRADEVSVRSCSTRRFSRAAT
jgi:hypothetical protein